MANYFWEEESENLNLISSYEPETKYKMAIVMLKRSRPHQPAHFICILSGFSNVCFQVFFLVLYNEYRVSLPFNDSFGIFQDLDN